MPTLTISAVNATTDQLTVTAHGRATGDGFFAIYTDTGTLPGGLSPVTDYWVIVVDANTIKLATSSANALAGTAVDITTTGSGTLLLVYGLPYRRPRIMVPRSVDVAGAQVKSADLNAVFSSLEAIWNHLSGQAQSIFNGIKLATGQHFTVQGTGQYRHGDRTLVLPASAFQVSDGTASASKLTTSGYIGSTSSLARVMAPLPLPAGKRIKTVQVFYNRNGAGSVTFQLLRTDVASGGIVAVSTSSTDSTDNGIESQTLSPSHTMLATAGYEVAVDLTAVNNRVYGAIIVYDEP